MNKKFNNYFWGFLLQFIAVLCLILSTNGAPQQNRRGFRTIENPSGGPNPQEIALAKVTNQGTSIDTAFGKVNSVQEACSKCFAVHILKLEILQIT